MSCIEIETVSEVLKKLGFSRLKEPVIIIGLNPYAFVELNRGSFYVCSNSASLKKLISEKAKEFGKSDVLCVSTVYIVNNVTDEWIARYRIELMYQEEIDDTDIIAILRSEHKSFFRKKCIPLSDIFKEIK